MVNNKTLKIKYLTIIIFVFSFLLFRPYFLQNQGMMYSGDDENYFAHTTSLVFFEFPDYEGEYWSGSTGSYPSHSIGPAIMSLPFTMIFSLVDRATDSGIVHERNRENNETSWTAFGFIISTIVYYYFGCILLFLALCYFFNERVSFLVVVFMAIFQYLPLYAFRRPIFSHIYEFFLQCVLVFILIKNYKEDFLKNSFKVAVITGLILALSFLVRYENIFIAAVWPLTIAYSVYRLENRKQLLSLISFF